MSTHSSKGAAWRRFRVEILNRDGWTCQACGNELIEGHAQREHQPTVDHIVPKAKDGRDEHSNAVAMCMRCNGLKGDKSAPPRIDWINTDWLARGS
ncbi:HNH endonuclease [Microbacterium murale]|uniref:5-methylcytosine-specific restriction endonuclease McrA n=1 Tax=Microbacterium murale TaxID=1081040 RepID=A0ABU0PEB7_9MICO|nr:HNH endonuclease [Microbacterium murale]MDQ0645655.1 5-methylcytosine-specific restriction endonuclease McrA [Microbacterium murale]